MEEFHFGPRTRGSFASHGHQILDFDLLLMESFCWTNSKHPAWFGLAEVPQAAPVQSRIRRLDVPGPLYVNGYPRPTSAVTIFEASCRLLSVNYLIEREERTKEQREKESDSIKRNIGGAQSRMPAILLT